MFKFGIVYSSVNAQFNPANHLNIINNERTKNGLKPLTYSVCLNNAAQSHSNYMATKQNLTSVDPHGNLFQFYNYFNQVSVYNVAMNIGMGYQNDNDILSNFFNSSGERKNLLNSKVTQLGVATSLDSRGWIYWTQVFSDGTCSKKS